MVYSGDSPSAAWKLVFTALDAKGFKVDETRVHPVAMFGVSEKAIKEVLERLPNVAKCRNYIFPGGHPPTPVVSLLIYAMITH